MHQLLVEFDGFAPALQILLPLAVCAGIVSLTVRRLLAGPAHRPHAALVDALLVYFALFAGYLVLTPQPENQDRLRLSFGADLWEALRAAPGDSQPWIQLAGNLVLLMPLGVLVPMRVSWFHNLGRVTLGGLVTATCIETVQFLAISGRVASTDDIVLNTAGVTIGGLLLRVLWRPVSATEPVRAQHSPSHADTETVWRIIDKIERERHRTPARPVRSTRSARSARPMRVRPVREPAGHP